MAASEIEKLERMVRENPKGRLFASLADAYRKDGQYPKALEVLEAGLANHPDYVSARVVLGRVHLATGDRSKAREAFARVVQLDPESVIALKALADLAEEEGQGEEALRWSGQLLTVDPGNDEAIKQQERLAAAAPPVSEVRLSGIVPVQMEEVAEQYAHSVDGDTAIQDLPAATPATPAEDPEKTVAPFAAVKPPVLKTVEIPVIPAPGAPSFAAAPEPLEQAPEPLPLIPLSEEAQTEQVAASVTPMAALEPTSFDEPASAPTERLAGLDPVGLTQEEVAAIGATSGFEPTSGPMDTTDAPRSSLIGLETMSGELAAEAAPAAEVAPEPGLERTVEIELGASQASEFQEASVAETLSHQSGVNEFQDASDGDLLDASAAQTGEAIETGGTDLAFITPAPDEPAYAAPLVPEEPEPAMTEPEPVVTESMAELYASQGHLTEALEVYRLLAAREPAEPRYQERIVELEMYAGGAMPEVASSPEVEAAPATGETVGAWFAALFRESLPGVTPAAEPIVAGEMAMAESMAPDPSLLEPYEPPPAPEPEPEPEPLPDLATESEHPRAEALPPRGEPTRPASGSFSLSNVFETPKPPASGSFDDFFGSTPAAPATEETPGRSTRPSGAQPPPADDDISSFQDWLKGLKK